MLRLSQRAWNNVLIFAMLFMILLFNTSHNFLVNDDESELQPLLPDNALIMSIDFGQTKIERIGQTWRLNPASQRPHQGLDKIVNHWQQSSIAWSDQPLTGSPIVAVVWLAGQSEGRVYQFFVESAQLFVKVEQQQFRVVDTQLSELVLMEHLD